MRLVNFFLLLLIWGQPALAADFFPKPALLKIGAPQKNREEAYQYGYNGQSKTNEIAGVGNWTTAKFWEYGTREAKRKNLDPVSAPWESPYAVNHNNPILLNDPNGDCPMCVVVGAVTGAVIGGGIELGSQLYHNGSVTNWKAVGGSAIQGGITGGVAGLTGGASLLVTTSSTVAANVVGGTVNRTIQGQPTTTKDVAVDAAVGGASAFVGHFAGKYVTKAINNLSRNTKGQIGEAVTKLKYGAQGYIDKGKAVVETGGTTPTGRVQTAIYDFNFLNLFSGENITVESKFNSSGLTPNQAAAASKVTTPGGLIIDRTTSKQLGDITKQTIVGGSGIIDNNINKK